jgi:hypothetical protein
VQNIPKSNEFNLGNLRTKTFENMHLNRGSVDRFFEDWRYTAKHETITQTMEQSGQKGSRGRSKEDSCTLGGENYQKGLSCEVYHNKISFSLAFIPNYILTIGFVHFH